MMETVMQSTTKASVAPPNTTQSTAPTVSMASFFSCSNHCRRLAMCTFEKFTSAVPKAPLPIYSERLVDVSEGRGPFSFGSINEQNQWLARTIVTKLRTATMGPAFLKALMLLHDVLVHGSSEFVDAFQLHVEGNPLRNDTNEDSEIWPLGVFDFLMVKFDRRIAEVSSGNASMTGCSAIPPNANVHDVLREHITPGKFFLDYVHALFEFQLRHRRMGNLLKHSSTAVVSSLGRAGEGARTFPQPTPALDEAEAATVATWSPIYRDVAYSCMTLIKYIVAAQTCIPKRCFVTGEVFRRYVVDCCHLYQLTSRCLQHNMLSAKSCKYFTFAEGKKNVACLVQYHRTTIQLEQFFDVLRNLSVPPDGQDSAIDTSVIPPRMDTVVTAIGDYLAYKLKMIKCHEEVEVESLDSLLARTASIASTHEKSSPASTEGHSADLSDSAPRGFDDFASEAITVDIPAVAKVQNNDDAFSTAQSFFNEGIQILRTPTGRSEFCPTKFDVPQGDEEDEVAQAEKFRQAGAAIPTGSASVSDVDHSPNIIRQRSEATINLEPGTAKRPVLLRDSFNRKTSPNDSGDEKHDRRFQVLEGQVLGRGGFGVVYKAWDEEEGRHVACKEVKLAQDKSGLAELRKEYNVLTTLDHPNIVKVLGFEMINGNGRIFMEWVPSGSVQAVLQETKRGLREAIVRRYVREALQGLAYLHSRGIVHRDVKPGNMLLSADGAVKLTDFGTSRALEQAGATMQTGTVVGTVPYLAPECMRGTYSAASDIWAIGCSALHMITGRAPWSDEAQNNVALIFKLGNLTKPDEVAILLRGIESPAVRDFVSAALRLERHERPSAAALLSHPFLM